MDRSQLLELRNKFARLDEIFNSFQREPRPLEDMETWRERFQALFMQLATNNKFPDLTKSLAIAPSSLPLNDSSIPFYENILRTRPDSNSNSDACLIEDEVVRKRAEILLANLTKPSSSGTKMETKGENEDAAGGPPEELIEALKLFY